MELDAEIESIDAIFGDEVTHSQDRHGNTLLNVFMDRKLILTFVIKCKLICRSITYIASDLNFTMSVLAIPSNFSNFGPNP